MTTTAADSAERASQPKENASSGATASSVFETYRLLEASGLFDEAYYRQSYSQLVRDDVDLLLHYIEHGARQGLRPNREFDPADYLAQCAARGEHADNPLLHYIQSGAHTGLHPSRSFAAAGPVRVNHTWRNATDITLADARPAARRMFQLDELALSAEGALQVRGQWNDAAPPRQAGICLPGGQALACSLTATPSAADGAATTFRIELRAVLPAPLSSARVRFALQLLGRNERPLSLEFVGSRRDAVPEAGFELRQLPPMRLHIESPEPATMAVVTDELIVSGWTWGGSGIVAVEIDIDGKTAVAVAPRLARADVQAAFGGNAEALRSGFTAYVPRRFFGTGLLHILVHAIDRDGLRTSAALDVQVEPGRFESGIDDRAELLVRELSFQLGEMSERWRSLATDRAMTTPLQRQVQGEAETLAALRDALDAPQGDAQKILRDALPEAVSVLARQRRRALSARDRVRSMRRYAPLQLATSTTPSLSIVIPVYDQFFHTYQCLASLQRHPPEVPFEVLIADDASTDETCWITDLCATLRVIRSPRNRGFVGNCNAAARSARAPLLMLLNNDTVLTEGAIDAMLRCFDNDQTGLVGAKLLFADGTLQEAGGIVWRDGSASNYGRSEDPDDPRFNFRRSVDYCSGAAIIIRTALWRQLRGFDRRFAPGYYEDTDLAFRVREAGYDVVYQPHARIYHLEGATAGTAIDAGMKAHQAPNRIRFRRKWAQLLESQGQPGHDAPLFATRGPSACALFLDACTPTPDQDAGSNVAVEHMRLLQQLGYHVSFAPAETMSFDPHYTTQLQDLGIETLYQPWHASVEDLLRARGREFALVYVHRYSVGEDVIPHIRRHAPQARILFNNADLHYLRLQREAELLDSAELMRAALDVKRRELAVIASCDAALICNTTEIDLIHKELPGAELHYLPWIIRVPGTGSRRFAARSGIMFLGGYGHPPNVDAVVYFVREVMPRIRRISQDLRLHLYGSKLTDTVRELQSADVIVEGYAADLQAVFARHRMSLAPLRYGAGFKGKLATSLAHGLPVVATSMAVEGTALDEHAGVLICDDPATMAEEICSLYVDTRRLQALGAAGRRHVQTQYSPARARSILQAAISGASDRFR